MGTVHSRILRSLKIVFNTLATANTRKHANCTSLNTVSTSTIIYKLQDLKKYVNDLASCYDCCNDAGNGEVKRILANMNEKVAKAEQATLYSKSIVDYCLTEDYTERMLCKLAMVKKLFRDLVREFCSSTVGNPELVLLMCHLITCIESGLVNFKNLEVDYDSTMNVKCICNKPSCAKARDEIAQISTRQEALDELIDCFAWMS